MTGATGDEEGGLVELVLEDPAWEEALPGLSGVAETAVRLAVEAAGRSPDRWSVVVLACSDDRIAELNAGFRGREQPTNVLSWPAFDSVPPDDAAPVPPGEGRAHLGDVAIARQTMAREAREAAIPLKDHAAHLILHGCLHLFGFDHEQEEDAREMEGLERAALARIGLPDPYERGDAATPHPEAENGR